ncbi:iron chelate uptake ABC transporter family permease subunit [Janibacter corallicola]|uniref:iron chelate uptake ABC transporter family permease subunit n=1 Tax=Janibacter corallicola TaxID=415212 RepID=UPI000A4F9B2A|nr:iron chelate uptake ABC transporter family permease subunit [Janibacter corallicola]
MSVDHVGTTRPVAKGGADPLRPRRALLGLLAAALVSVGIYLTIDLSGNIAWLLERRATTLATMVLVSVAVGAATVVFHTVTANQILTPSIMGFDALYVLIQTVAVTTLGVSGIHGVPTVVEFGVETVIMVGLSLLLYTWLLLDLRRSLHLLVLVGVVIGGLFRSISELLQRVMDPTAFAVLQDRFFADFTGRDQGLLLIGAIIVAGTGLLLWRGRGALDVVSLGREVSTSLGVEHRRVVLLSLTAVALLVATATALVGPTSFFGLLVAHLAYRLVGSTKHEHTLPAAALASVVCLVGGQLLFERVLGFEGSLSMVVEFLGGILFIALLLGRSRA